MRVASADDPLILNSFKSHYESGLKPQPLEEDHAVIYMAVSLWKSESEARKFARTFKKIGDHIALVRLRAGMGFDYLDPAHERHPEHLTIWGDKLRLAQSVVDVVPLE